MRTIGATIFCIIAACALTACGSKEIRMADATTRAVYDNDIDGVTHNFTPDLAKQVNRAELGALSDVMHGHGDYKGLTETGSEPDGAFDFRADFSNGSMLVKMKLDSDGRISGYRVIPEASSPAPK
jgi:hypothetical protein